LFGVGYSEQIRWNPAKGLLRLGCGQITSNQELRHRQAGMVYLSKVYLRAPNMETLLLECSRRFFSSRREPFRENRDLYPNQLVRPRIRKQR
jgi:hypothetical protein